MDEVKVIGGLVVIAFILLIYSAVTFYKRAKQVNKNSVIWMLIGAAVFILAYFIFNLLLSLAFQPAIVGKIPEVQLRIIAITTGCGIALSLLTAEIVKQSILPLPR